MTDAVLLAIIAAIPPTIASIVAAAVSILNSKKIEVIHKATNSMKDELMAVTRSDALQEGHTRGVADEKAGVAP